MRLVIFMYYFILFASILQMLEQWYKNIFANPIPHVSSTLHIAIGDTS